MVLRACSACGVSKAKRQYSHNQWQKIEAASKCKTCVEQAQSAAAAAAAATGRGVTGWKGGKEKGLPNPGSNHSGDAGPAELTDAEVGWCAELDAALEEDGGGESGDVNRDTTELDSDDLERRTEEAETLMEIYPGFAAESNNTEWLIPIQEQHPFAAYLRLLVPENYPSRSPPTPIIDAPWLTDTQVAEYSKELAALAEESSGCEVGFLFVEHMKERLEQTTTMQEAAMIAAEADKVELAAASAAAVSTAAEAMVPDSDESPLLSSREIGTEEGGWGSDGNSLTLQAVGAGGCEGSGGSGGRAGSGEEWVFQPANSHFKQPNRKFDPDAFRDTNTVDIVHGETFIDRKSKFEAHLAAVSTGAQVSWVYRTLLQDKRIARASHNVVSWRYFDENKQVQCSDNDDDGEAGAGNRLAEMMHLMGANGVFVMVSRYYGGVHLGPDRFKHFNNCARELLDAGGFRKEKLGKGKKKK